MSNEFKAAIETLKTFIYASFLAGIALLIFYQFSLQTISLYLLLWVFVYLIYTLYKFNLHNIEREEEITKI